MSRPRRCRRVGFRPNINFFKPSGKRKKEIEGINLAVEELEAVRLKDFMGFDQNNAASKMHVSQPTFHRLLTIARKKIADALINGKSLRIEGGNFKLANSEFEDLSQYCVCTNCGYKERKVRMMPCLKKECPNCGAKLRRGN
ncbi:MAG: DUF134 domain-containing protein [Nanoarchaeota archaeon]|nr:DUF134 domain-containing protein [Nanoarchaeota archaeon]